jgi:hypothetical protein
VKVAQYEVLGNDAERHVRPVSPEADIGVTDDRNARLLGSHVAQRLAAFRRSSRSSSSS